MTLLTLLLLACTPASVVGDDTGGGGDGGTSGDGGTGGDGGFTVPDMEISELSWSLHDEVEAMVWVSWAQDQSGQVRVEYSFENDEWHQTREKLGTAGRNQVLVVGVPFGTTASWRVVSEGGVTVEGDPFTTGDVPSDLPLASVEVLEEDKLLPTGKYLLSSINADRGGWTGGDYWTFIVDRKGRPVWASLAPNRHWTIFAQVALSGDHILWDEATYWSDWDSGAGSTVHRTYLDQEIEEIATPGLHHAFVQLPDDTLAWGSQYHGGGEALVERAPGSDVVTTVWTASGEWPGSGRDPESNGLFYDAERNSYLYSYYTNSSVVEVDRATGKSLWWAGEVGGGYAFSPSTTQFTWQHGISYTEAGTLLVSTHKQDGSMTIAREYEVDHENETLNHVWSYDSGVYADTNGDTWRLENGNTLHLVGSSGHLFEVAADSSIVWHLDFNANKLLGRGQLIEDLYDLVSPEAR